MKSMDEERNTLIDILNKENYDLKEKQIVVWGIGNTARLYQDNIRKLEKEGLNIVYYADSNPQKWESTFNGKPVIDPKQIGDLERVFVVICSMSPKNTAEIKSLLVKSGIEGAGIDRVVFSRHSKEVIETYDMLEDMESKRVYAALIKVRMDVVNPPADIVAPDQYYCLPYFESENENEVLVECGGYIGDTLEAYVRKKNGKFKQVISFEPDFKNRLEFKEKVGELTKEFGLGKEQIILYPYAVGDREEKLHIMRSETDKGNLVQVVPMKEEAGCKDEEVKMVALDDFLTMPYSFLKADTEGYEKEILRGAEKGIREYKPLLAICIYHNAMDFYEIPMLIKRMVPEYKLAVRHHLGTLSETVIYAYREA